jgi:5'-phosphate synthase pdxT subunit
VGVFGLQGDVEEHIAITSLALKKMGLKGDAIWTKTAVDAENVDGLIIPGGESTVIGTLATYNRAMEMIKQRIYGGMPVLGTCAGLVLLANRVYDRVVGEVKQPTLSVMDITVERNAFGRQKESFEADLDIPVLGNEPFRGVFIRAPAVRELGREVKALCRINGTVVAVQQDNIIGTAFHPELTTDIRLHRYFLDIIKANL